MAKGARVRVALLQMLVAFPVLGHDLYLMPQKFVVAPGEVFTIAFHNGDDFPKSAVAPRIPSMLDAQVWSAGGTKELRNLRTEGLKLLADGSAAVEGSAVVSVRSRPNKIELAPEKFEEYLKHEGLTKIVQWRKEHGESGKAGLERYSKYVKAIVEAGKPSDGYKHVVGFPIEIIPEANPSSLRAGSSFPVRIVFRGKPVGQQEIEAAWLAPDGKATIEVAGKTDATGRLQIPIRGAGVWKLHSILMERCQEPAEADWESFWASLSFEVR